MGDPAQRGVDVTPLESLKARTETEGSEVAVVVKDGRILADWDFGKKRRAIHAMSATKSVVSLAIGRLIDEGKVQSLDQPFFDFFPEWRQGCKRLIAVRHRLNHTNRFPAAENGHFRSNPEGRSGDSQPGRWARLRDFALSRARNSRMEHAPWPM